MRMKRKYLPTLAELIDRMSISQLKEVFIAEHRHEYSKEIEDIVHDIQLMLDEKDTKVTAETIRAIVVLAQMNLHIWHNEANYRKGIKDSSNNLELTHGLNGIRNTAKNVIQEIVGGRKDYKTDCLAADFKDWEISWSKKTKMSQIYFKDLADIRERHKDQKIVFCSGCFDLMHVGHILFFEDCKKQGDILVVGVGPDADLKKYKGEDRPILNEQTRLKMVSSIDVVDYALIPPPTQPGNLLEFLHQIFEKLQPDTYVVNEDAFGISIRKEIAKKFKTNLVVLKRTCPPEFENVSTTSIIDKVKNLD